MKKRYDITVMVTDSLIDKTTQFTVVKAKEGDTVAKEPRATGKIKVGIASLETDKNVIKTAIMWTGKETLDIASFEMEQDIEEIVIMKADKEIVDISSLEMDGNMGAIVIMKTDKEIVDIAGLELDKNIEEITIIKADKSIVEIANKKTEPIMATIKWTSVLAKSQKAAELSASTSPAPNACTMITRNQVTIVWDITVVNVVEAVKVIATKTIATIGVNLTMEAKKIL